MKRILVFVGGAFVATFLTIAGPAAAATGQGSSAGPNVGVVQNAKSDGAGVGVDNGGWSNSLSPASDACAVIDLHLPLIVW